MTAKTNINKSEEVIAEKNVWDEFILANVKSEEVIAEKKLWDVFLLTQKLKISNFNFYFCTIIFIMLIVNAIFIESSTRLLIKDIRMYISFGLNSIISILGFLIAGFTIFATVSKPKMFLMMMAIKEPKTKLPYLKYYFAAFMGVFIHYLFLFFVYAIIFLLIGQDGKNITNKIYSVYPMIAKYMPCVLAFTYALIGTSLIYLLILLKTFIFNIYHVIMFIISWEYQMLSKDKHI